MKIIYIIYYLSAHPYMYYVHRHLYNIDQQIQYSQYELFLYPFRLL
jgi:hypothetical protein